MREFPAATPLPGAEARPRELQAAYDIAHAFLTAASPDEVYSLALERVSPLVGASFASVFLRNSPDTLRMVASWNWPPQYEEFLDEMTVRVGNGPTGQAVAENRVVEVFDIFADPLLSDW
ncbi:MAG TPA: GAF domain-containing protein, partial [Longimicrobium sp.]|nr:GAF domain-containing protein [Longimicrobium sp.]